MHCVIHLLHLGLQSCAENVQVLSITRRRTLGIPRTRILLMSSSCAEVGHICNERRYITFLCIRPSVRIGQVWFHNFVNVQKALSSKSCCAYDSHQNIEGRDHAGLTLLAFRQQIYSVFCVIFSQTLPLMLHIFGNWQCSVVQSSEPKHRYSSMCLRSIDVEYNLFGHVKVLALINRRSLRDCM